MSDLKTHYITEPSDFPQHKVLQIMGTITIMLALPAFLFLFEWKTTAVAGYFGLLSLLIISCFPRFAYFLFLGSTAIFAPYYLNWMAIHPYDLTFAVLLLSIVLDFLFHRNSNFRHTKLDIAFILLIVTTIVSAIFAFDISKSIVAVLRICLVYFAFRITMKFGIELTVRRLITVYIWQTTLFATIVFLESLQSGGAVRSFGVSGPAIRYFIVTAFPMSLAFLIWSRTFFARVGYTFSCLLMGLGLLATQSRAPIVALIITVPVLLWGTFRKAKREKNKQTIRMTKYILIPLILLIIVVIAFADTQFGAVLVRINRLIDSIQHPQGTIATRLVLWSAALKAFQTSPIVGIGIGNMKILSQILPELRTVPLWIWVKGMSAHNVLLHYLAETGITGTVALLFLFGRTYYSALRSRNLCNDPAVGTALWISAFVCFITLFYEQNWTWGQPGYVLSFLFGLIAAEEYRHNRPVPNNDE